MSLLVNNPVDVFDAHKGGVEEERKWTFECVPGFFKQDDESTDDTNFDLLAEDFGLAKPSWAALQAEVANLNASTPDTEVYKLLFLARHGQGWHNFAVEKYGMKAWDDYWSHLNGDGEIVWGPDPLLTELGKSQAKENNRGWKQQLAKGAPLPVAYYSSPFTRSCQTAVYTWLDLSLTESKDPHPVFVKEDIRETIGGHTCDKRNLRSVTEERFTRYGFEIEEGFTEEDELYSDDREKLHMHGLRINRFLQFLYEKDFGKTEQDTYVSVTSHSGTIRAFVLALAHRKFAICTGGMMPILVKGTRAKNESSL
ncbi:hypothetical protein BABINDRAFT_172907 [Babjeviella inositovora NRRL Y-12698]|uniref:Phosphoglycerate mutase n=1 Tax=Babjeviella inositovora NRRL Y-12698 TaxID=984486 RepID=A0A1E3QIF6_9ASCO|nr:uncharacterized protein BABINDRAFT_172907 [Babjeviella inositovora NRRL Y-12698]ODQ77388.1 hypothetical protein BABINDRAFT_172907 [Babjeviella inositovora NRRL Y-12698]